MKIAVRFVTLIFVLTVSLTLANDRKTDAEIRKQIIKQSIAAYQGSCPCPYSVDRAGKSCGARSCGARSAYSKPGGKAPLCYDTDVTQKMVDDYRKKNKS